MSSRYKSIFQIIVVFALVIIPVFHSVAAQGAQPSITLLIGSCWKGAILRYDGKTWLGSNGHLAMSFFCGPYIMLQMGWKQEDDGTLSVGSVLVSALVAFGWSFIQAEMVSPS